MSRLDYTIIWLIIFPGGNSTYWHVMRNGVLEPATNIAALNLPPEAFNEPLRIAIEVIGNTFTAYVNGEYKNTLSDHSFTAGKIGVHINMGYELPAAWDEIKVKEVY
jgi:hypothetical protein